MTFASLKSAIELVFTSAPWTSHNIAIYPDNYQGQTANQNEFCRLNILPATTANNFGGSKTFAGSIIVSIYVKAGEGQSRIMAIADILDILLGNKKLTNGPELGTSYLQIGGLDSANSALYTAQYVIPFKTYGE
jgi:hypothetical protein